MDLPFKLDSKINVSSDALQRALKIIYAELESENEERRFQAAIELLRFAK
jgi:hypothetical protein